MYLKILPSVFSSMASLYIAVLLLPLPQQNIGATPCMSVSVGLYYPLTQEHLQLFGFLTSLVKMSPHTKLDQ